MIKYLAILTLIINTGVSFAQEKKVIISIPDFEDYNSISFIQKYLDTAIDRSKTTIVLMDYVGFFSALGEGNELDFDTLNLYCPKQYELIKTLKENDVKAYGTVLSSDIFEFLKTREPLKYKILDDLSISVTGKHFEESYSEDDFLKQQELVDYINLNFGFSDVEKLIFSRLAAKRDKDSVFIEKLYTLFDGDCFILHDQIYKISELPDFEKVNLLPHRVGLSTVNSKIRKNRFKFKVSPKPLAQLQDKALPRKIRLNDFITLKRKDIKGELNFYSVGTSSCKIK